MSPANTEHTSGPGRILKAAREELGYSVSYVADALHLRSSVVDSIESEDYESFNSEVFLKGYIRSYCRLVNLHEERMIELIDVQLSSSKKAEADIEAQALKARKARKNAKKAVFIALIVFVFAIIYSFVFSPSDTANNESGEQTDNTSLNEETAKISTDESAETNVKQPPENVSAESPEGDAKTIGKPTESSVNQHASSSVAPDQEESNDTSKSLEETAAIQPAVEKSVVEKKVVEKAVVEPAVESTSMQPDDLISGSESTAQTNESATVVTEPLSEIEYVSGKFTAEFTADCWFTLSNGAGKKVFAALKKAGQSVQYEGPLPFHIVLGDARAVSATFNDGDVDITPYTRRNGRAEFDLGIQESTQGE